MAIKEFLLVVSIASMVNGGLVFPRHATADSSADYDHNPQYTFGYDVQDAFTGDSKSQVESRSGDVVHGQYSLNDPDGTRRIVDYTADPINGFNAVVRKTPLVAAPVVGAGSPYSRYISHVVSTPLAYSTPIAPYVLAGPYFRTSPYY